MPIFTPTGTQMSVEIASSTTTLANVAKPNPMRLGKRAKPRWRIEVDEPDDGHNGCGAEGSPTRR